MNWARPANLAVRQIWQSDDDGNRSDVEVREVNFRCLSGIVQGNASTATENLFRQRNRILGNVVAAIIQYVDTPVAHFAGAGVPIPVPVVVQLFAVNRLVLSWAEPRIVGDVLFNLRWRIAVAE
ncbi:hypothetical protein N9Z67_02400 [Rhodopirellula sp.]|nr:hypothetical protein [Rhodopirellula sp.]